MSQRVLLPPVEVVMLVLIEPERSMTMCTFGHLKALAGDSSPAMPTTEARHNRRFLNGDGKECGSWRALYQASPRRKRRNLAGLAARFVEDGQQIGDAHAGSRGPMWC